MTLLYRSSSSATAPPPATSIRPEIGQLQTLIPGLPNDVASLILSFVPYSHQHRLRCVCRSWRVFLSSSSVLLLRLNPRNRHHRSHLICIFPQDPSIAPPYLFDPQNLAWCPLPPLPPNPHVYGLCNFAAVSLGPHLYVLGGSVFDTRSYPLDRPSASSAVFRFNFTTYAWDMLAPMITPRGSFACAAVPSWDQILVAGGGSRHAVFRAAGTRLSSVERYDVKKNEWVAMDGLPRYRAGCMGFIAGSGEEKQFWVIGGYGDSRIISGVFPVDEYYRNAVVMDLKNGGRRGTWRDAGDMWEEGDWFRRGKIAVVEDEDRGVPDVFMLNGIQIFRYDMITNRWQRESSIPRNASGSKSFGFVAVDRELYVLTVLVEVESSEVRWSRESRQVKRTGALLLQIYHPEKKTWRFTITKSPFRNLLDSKIAVLCNVRL